MAVERGCGCGALSLGVAVGVAVIMAVGAVMGVAVGVARGMVYASNFLASNVCPSHTSMVFVQYLLCAMCCSQF